MLLSKKITKLNTRNGDHKAKPQNPPRVKDPNKNQRCRFVPIPQPSKHLYKDPVYTLHGVSAFILCSLITFSNFLMARNNYP